MSAHTGKRASGAARPTSAAVIQLVCLGALIGVAYYAGAAIGLALKLPHATPSVLWPPNAILTSALLLTPRRVWPFALLSALPAHIALEAGVGWPMTLVLALFATNCSEALLAAGGLRWLSDAPTRFDSLRRITTFLGVVAIAAPVLSSFLDAGAVSLVLGEPYWPVWTARLFSNMLTALMVVPALVMVVTSGRRWLTTAPRSQHVEAASIAAAMLLVAVFVLRDPGPHPITTELVESAALAWFLPLMVWAAIRFGPAGLSPALLGSSLVLVSAAIHSHGPFRNLSPADTTLALQLFLFVVSVPLLVLASLIEERRLVQQDISDRLALEALLARLSGAFVQLPSNRMREVFTDSLRHIGESLRLDCLLLHDYTESASPLTLAAAWAAPGSHDCIKAIAGRDLRGALEGCAPHTTVFLDDLTTANRGDGRAAAVEERIASGVAIPLVAERKLLGALVCMCRAPLGSREAAIVEELQLVARVLANALARKSTEDSLRASEATKSAILSSLTYGVVVLDRDGRIITVNERWRQMIGADAPAAATQAGAGYLDFYQTAHGSGDLWAADAAQGVSAVLSGGKREFRLEHVLRGPCGNRTIALRAVPLERPEGGAVITHADLTDQRRAELEAQRARADLAHVSRVATMGALTASIAHQLNQPLTGILTNAQAARRFLAAASPDLDEARITLEDIMADARRASEVIVRMREFLRKDEGLVDDVELNALAADVARLVNSDAIIRTVALVLQLDTRPATVRGDRVQLQQVVLNLIVNALEALGERRTPDRRVVVRCVRPAPGYVEMSVTDNGPGFNGTHDAAFDAFFTTKPTGMGLGLSIARSIVEAHAGAIHAANNPEGGATVRFSLPLARHEVS